MDSLYSPSVTLHLIHLAPPCPLLPDCRFAVRGRHLLDRHFFLRCFLFLSPPYEATCSLERQVWRMMILVARKRRPVSLTHSNLLCSIMIRWIPELSAPLCSRPRPRFLPLGPGSLLGTTCSNRHRVLGPDLMAACRDPVACGVTERKKTLTETRQFRPLRQMPGLAEVYL